MDAAAAGQEIVPFDGETFLAYHLIEVIDCQEVDVGGIVPLVRKQTRSWARGR